MTAHREPRIPPGLVLYILAPLVAELMSGVKTPDQFFTPGMVAISIALYGGGAVLIREWVLVWRRGWPSIVILGIAYALVEEALMVKAIFNPNFGDLGAMAQYGRAAGVNWVYAAALIVYHASVSICLPIAIVEAIYPSRIAQSWVSLPVQFVLMILMVVDVLVGYFYLTSYRPSALHTAVTVTMVGGLVWSSRHLPRVIPKAGRAPHPWIMGVLAFSAFLGFVFLQDPTWQRNPATTILAILGLAAALFWIISRYSARTSWGIRHRVALLSGVLASFCLLQLIAPAENRLSTITVALSNLLLILVLNLHVRRTEVARTSV